MKPQKILLLENVATQASGVREHLSQAGYQVAVSRYEADGLKRLVEWSPDLVLVSTVHPAGDFGDYCRRLRELGPGVRIIVTSSLSRERFFHKYPGLQNIVDGVLMRPYSHEEVAAALSSATSAPSAPPADPAEEPGNAELRAEFQRQLDARFLEVEELKRHLEVATRRAASAPGLEWLQSENEHLRQAVEETRKKAALAFATEQLKRSEIEVKLDNLLRMKEDFEFRAQNEIEERTREVELVRGQLQELRELSEKATGEHAVLRVEMERALVEKEQIEERLHALEAGGVAEAAPPADPERIAVLEAELSSQRALVAEGQVALADMAARAAVLEESLVAGQPEREQKEQLLVQVQALRGQVAEVQRGSLELETRHEGLQERLGVAENAALEARTALATADAGRAGLEKELADVRQALSGETVVASGLRERLAAAEASALEARAALAAADAGRAGLEKELADVRQALSGETGVASDLRARLAAAESSALETRAAQVAGEASALEARAALAAADAGRADLEKELADVRQALSGETGVASDLRERLAAAESSALETRAALAAADAGRADLEKELADVRQALSGETGVASDLRERLAAAESSALETRAALAAAESSAAAARQHPGEGAEHAREALERAMSAEGRNEQLQSACTELELRLTASEAARISVAAEAESLVEQRGAEAEKAVQGAEILGRELAESRDRARDLAAESARLAGALEERERVLTAEVRSWRDRAEAAELEILLLQTQGVERANREEEERRTLAERQELAGRDLAKKDLLVATLREELAGADAALAAAREDFAARERETRIQMETQQASTRELVEQLTERTAPAATASPVQAELHRIQELLEEVISRARTEAVEYARRDTELTVRLQAALEERRLLQERFDRAGAEAAERERRSSSLLQSAIDHGSPPLAERANLPACVPPDLPPAPDPGAGPGAGRVIFRWNSIVAGLAVVTLAVLLAVFGLRRSTPPADREQAPAVPRQQSGPLPGAAPTPREVWERWTRSDGSGGVLVQATLRGQEELRAEVEADRAPGMSDEAVRAELLRRLSAFQFNTTYYVTVYLKNFASGYPAYLDDLPSHFHLRDSKGREVPAFLPPGHEKDRRIFSFGAGPPGDLIYEASVSLGFDRTGLSPSAGYLQLVVSDIGASSRRVLTWELE